MNILLETNEDVRDKRLSFQKQQKEYYIKTKDNISDAVNEEILKKRRERAKVFYANNKERCKSYRNPILSKINLYVSAMNTGKIKHINEDKLNEYHISFNKDINKYEVNTEYAISLYKNK